jgi:hypothetical protein
MNVIEFKSQGKPVVFCCIDHTHRYASEWTRELIKNLADYTISNITAKGYDILQSQSEESALNLAVSQGYKYAVVFSTGTEFINGWDFFTEVEKLTNNDFYIYGHILDRDEAYYELHDQCYLINLSKFKELGRPTIGQTVLGNEHQQIAPNRTVENIHDNYTPLHISAGTEKRTYKHKLHGWNIISKVLLAGGTISAFNDNIRNSKKHYYPEHQREFLKHVSWAYARYNYCANEFVHTANSDTVRPTDRDYEQIITPASGEWFTEVIAKDKLVTVIYYDYNQQSLDYWKQHAPKISNVTYEFIKIDLLGVYDISLFVKDSTKKTVISLSNIFCYEGTAMFSSLEYRLYKEKQLRSLIPKEWTVLSSLHSYYGFTNYANDVTINNLPKPTWHHGGDWIEH